MSLQVPVSREFQGRPGGRGREGTHSEVHARSGDPPQWNFDGIPLDITVLWSPIVFCKLVCICVLCVCVWGGISVCSCVCFFSECGAGANFFNIKISKDYGTWYLLALSSRPQNNFIEDYLLQNCWCLYDLEARAKFTKRNGWKSEDGELICLSRCSAPARTGRAGRPTSKELSHL